MNGDSYWFWSQVDIVGIGIGTSSHNVIYIYIDNVFSNLPRFANVLVSGCWKTAGFQGFWEFNGYAGVRYIGFCMFLRHVMTYMFVSYLPLLYRLEPSRLKRERVY